MQFGNNVFGELSGNIEPLLSSLVILFPGLLAFFIYVAFKTKEFREIKTSDILLILLFTFLFQIINDLSGELMNTIWYQTVFYFIFPLVIGIFSDIIHRLFVSVVVEKYQREIIQDHNSLERIDLGNVSRWQNTIRRYSLEEDYNQYYVEITTQYETKKGFLSGYSEEDIEIIRYEEIQEKDFTEIGELDTTNLETNLTLKTEVIPRRHITSISIYLLQMKNFQLQ